MPRHLSRPRLSAAGCGLLVLLVGGCHLEQVQIGQIFNLSTQATGACPKLQWQFFVDAQRAIHGTLESNFNPVAKITGVLNPDDTFRMDLTAATSNETATVSGTITSQGVTFAIAGNAAGAGCNGQAFTIYGRQLFQGNSYGGGGNG
jgi:hypothetical protein